MEKLPMCRICLVENVRMYVVANKNLQEIYENLTDVPFVTEDSRPMLACFFCYSKLKQCGQLQRKCLEAEKLFAQMLNEDCKANPLLNRGQLEFCSGFIISPTEQINIFDECQAESDGIKKELPDVCEGQDDIIEADDQSDELELEYQDTAYLDSLTDQDVIPDQSESEDIPPQHSESEEYIPSMVFELEGKQEVSKNKEIVNTENSLEYQAMAYLAILADQEDVIPDHSESEDTPPQHSESEDYIPSVVFEVERKQDNISKKKRRANAERINKVYNNNNEERESLPTSSLVGKRVRIEKSICTKYPPVEKISGLCRKINKTPTCDTKQDRKEKSAKRKPRTHFSQTQVDALEDCFRHSQYLTTLETEQLAASVNLSHKQVKIWFQNRRTKSKRTKSPDVSFVPENRETPTLAPSYPAYKETRYDHGKSYFSDQLSTTVFLDDILAYGNQNDQYFYQGPYNTG